VSPYIGYTTNGLRRRLRKKPSSWRIRTFTDLPDSGIVTERGFVAARLYAVCQIPDQPPRGVRNQRLNFVGLHSDALLYLGPRESLLTSPNLPDSYLDLDYRAELDRRMRLRLGNGLKPPDPINNPATARPYQLN
jgi:hypothetical protein